MVTAVHFDGGRCRQTSDRYMISERLQISKETMMKNLTVAILIASLVVVGSTTVRADQIVLSNGTALVGKQASVDPKKASQTLVLESGIELTLPFSSVRAVMPEGPNETLYLKNVDRVPDTIEGHQQMIAWANKNGLRDVATAHYQRLVELEPANRAAWAALQYNETSAGWIPRDRYWRAKGMVRDAGRWEIPQDVAIAQAIENRKKSSYEIKRKIDSSFRDLLANNNRAAEARQYLRELNDPNALPALVEQVQANARNDVLRMELINIIGRLPGRGAETALVVILVNEADAQIRNRCIDILDQRNSAAAVVKLQGYLVNNDPLRDRPETINRAAEALAVLGDERSIPRLIDVLVTEHQQKSGSQHGTNVGMTDNGGMGFSQGGQNRTTKLVSQNKDVLYALQTLSRESLPSYEKQAWLDWYASANADTGLQLRRDP